MIFLIRKKKTKYKKAVYCKNQTRKASLTQWQQPPMGWVKCNTDVGFHSDLNQTSAG
jgi:hypothetical protein